MEKQRPVTGTLDKDGSEVLDPIPLTIPAHLENHESIADMVRRFVRYQASQAADQAGEETFEEADDFAVGDEPELYSPYELDDEQAHARVSDFIEEKPKVKPNKPPEEPEPEDPKGPEAVAPTKAKKKAPAKKKPEPDPDPEEED